MFASESLVHKSIRMYKRNDFLLQNHTDYVNSCPYFHVYGITIYKLCFSQGNYLIFFD